MADVKYYYATGKDCNGQTVTLEIWGPYREEGSTEVKAGFPFINLRWMRDESQPYTDPIQHSEADINLIVDSQALWDGLLAIVQADVNTYSVCVRTGTGSPQPIFWTGVIQPLATTADLELDCYPKNVNLRVTDGLSLLREYNTHDALNDVFGTNFYNIMGNLRNFANFYPSSAQSVFYAPQITVTGAANQVFKDVRFEREFENDYEYLKAVLHDLCQYLVHTNGYWYIVGLLDALTGSFSGTWYKEDSLTAISSSTLTYSTTDVKTDTGGLMRFTPNYKDVRFNYSQSRDASKIIETGTSSSSPETVTVFPQTPAFNLGPYNEFTIRGRAWVSATSPASDDIRKIEIEIRYGTKYMNEGGSWTTTATWLDMPVDFVASFARSEGAFQYYINLLDTALSGTNNFSVRFRFTATDSANDSNIDEYYVELVTELLATTDNKFEYKTGTAKPALEQTIYFINQNILSIDATYSVGLAQYIAGGWARGATTGQLHEVAAAGLKTLTASVRKIVEARVNALAGPAGYYEVLDEYVGLPLTMDMDMITKEGNVTLLIQ